MTIGTIPRVGLRIARFGHSDRFLGGSTPDEAFGIWPDVTLDDLLSSEEREVQLARWRKHVGADRPDRVPGDLRRLRVRPPSRR
jgi:hypothetical protein